MTQVTCPKCGKSFALTIDDRFETKAIATTAIETKVVPFAFTVKAVDRKQRIIEGYASTPDLDHGDDIVEPNACKFDDTNDVGVYIGHDWRLGALPTGAPVEIRQDARGLFTKTRIYETARGDELLTVAEERLAIGKPLGQSIGFPSDSVKARFERKDGRLVRYISELRLAEYSFTPIPMNEKAVTTAVKSHDLKAADMSLSERQTEVREAIRDYCNDQSMMAGPFDPSSYVYVVDVYDDYVIVTDGDDYWQIPYEIAADGEATLGEPLEVDRVWLPKVGGEGDGEDMEVGKDQAWSSVNKGDLPKSAFAYAPGKNRSAWKLPHHNPDGSVNAQGVRSALAAVGGARTGKPMSVPATAREHLEAHAKALGIGDKTAAEAALEVKAGRVLSDANLTHLQEIHDRTHSMAANAGHDLHGDVDGASKFDPTILGDLLDLEHELAVANSTSRGGH